jgi:hypothetical protein
MSYAPLELGQPGNPPVPNVFEPDGTLLCPRSHKIMMQISVQAVMLQFGQLRAGAGVSGTGNVQWGPEEQYLPLTAVISRRFDAIRVRNYTPEKAAQVVLTALNEDD